MKLSKLKGSVRNVVDGAWVGDIPIQGLEGLNLKVRGTYNPDATRLRDELIAGLPEERRVILSEDDKDAIALDVLVDAILLDWDLEDGEGDAAAPVPCTPEARRQMLTDELLGEPLRRAVAYASSVVAQQGRTALETDAKN